MISSGLGHNLAELISEMSIVPAIMIFAGLMLIIIEFYQPSYGIPIYCGGTLTVCGILLRMLAGGNTVMLFYMVFFCAAVLVIAHVIMLRTQKSMWLTQSLALKLRSSAGDDEEEDGYGYLLGREGIATTDIDGTGHVLVDDVNLFVTSDTAIAKDSAVRVAEVTGDRIKVERTDPTDEG